MGSGGDVPLFLSAFLFIIQTMCVHCGLIINGRTCLSTVSVCWMHLVHYEMILERSMSKPGDAALLMSINMWGRANNDNGPGSGCHGT